MNFWWLEVPRKKEKQQFSDAVEKGQENEKGCLLR